MPNRRRQTPRPGGLRPAVVAVAGVLLASGTASAEDASPAAILQYFESTYNTLEYRMSDVFRAGYGLVYTPPPGRADTGGSSVGYDQYNRFDLGSTGNATLYGTETGLKSAIAAAHRAGLDYGIDFVLNHNGYGGTGTAAQNAAFYANGGYPGFVGPLQTTNPNGAGYNTRGFNSADGDFNGAFGVGDHDGRLAGLIDINHRSNFTFIRQPTTAGDPLNIPAGTNVNKVDSNNRRFYPDTSGAAGVKYLFDPTTGESGIPVYNYNTANPMAGVATAENATGLLMRNAQWLVQTIGVDAFRLDATKHVEPFVLNYFDRSVFRASTRTLLDGSQKQVYSWGEAFTGDTALLRSLIRKDINPADPGRIGGNRDTLDFPLFFTLKENLKTSGTGNDWRTIAGSSLDYADDGSMNGSIGVKFAGSHDDGLCDLSNVSYAYTMLLPGNAIVYDNAKQFGNGRDFPKGGRADALGGAYGESITKLVGLRNVYAQGNFIQRHLSKESYAFERNRQSITLLSNRGDNYIDNQSFDCGFSAGTYLVELTGNAAQYGAPTTLQVKDNTHGGGYVDVSFLPNNGGDHGYLVYGLQAPKGTLAIGNSNQTLAGGTPTLGGDTNNQLYQNATTRLAGVKVVTGNTFTATLNTTAVTLPNGVRDKSADGDNALFKLDEGIDLNGDGDVDFKTPGGVVYGFEQFVNTRTPGYTATTGNGTYSQSINTAGLAEGYHYLTARAFRQRADNGPAVYSDFKETIYVDRLKPVSSVNKSIAFGAGTGNNDVWIRSDDQTANSVKVFLNLPASLTDAQVIAKVQAGEGGSDQLDRDIFKKYFSGMGAGNNIYTVVTYEITGNVNVQRFPGQQITNGRGVGLGDTDFNGSITTGDITGTNYGFEKFLYARNTDFNPAADVNADGLIDNRDLFALPGVVLATNTAAQTAIRQTTLRRGNFNGGNTDAADIDILRTRLGKTGDNWFEDLNVDGVVTTADVDTLVHSVLLSEYGDADLNGRVNFDDFTILQTNFGQSGGWAKGDFSGNGVVDFNDFVSLQTHLGFGAAALGREQVAAITAFGRYAASVPEPASVAMVGVIAALGLRRRR